VGKDLNGALFRVYNGIRFNVVRKILFNVTKIRTEYIPIMIIYFVDV